jgi:hypothetical protein
VVLDICRGGNGIHEEGDVILASARLKLSPAGELLAQCERIDYIAALRERDHRAEDATVAFAKEHRVVHDFVDAIDCIAVHEHGRQNRLLRIFGVRWPSF